jgi:hypothetical protein
MKKLFIWLIMLLPLPILAAKCKDIDSLSLIQKHNLHFAYTYGEKLDLGYTLAAIALVESSAGKYRLNVRTNDLGLFQINATTAENTLKLEKYYDKLELHQRLVYDDILGAEIAIATLEHFRRDRVMTSSVWSEMIKSYNTGSQWRRDKVMKKKADGYLQKVSNTVKLLRKCEQYWK